MCVACVRMHIHARAHTIASSQAKLCVQVCACRYTFRLCSTRGGAVSRVSEAQSAHVSAPLCRNVAVLLDTPVKTVLGDLELDLLHAVAGRRRKVGTRERLLAVVVEVLPERSARARAQRQPEHVTVGRSRRLARVSVVKSEIDSSACNRKSKSQSCNFFVDLQSSSL